MEPINATPPGKTAADPKSWWAKHPFVSLFTILIAGSFVYGFVGNIITVLSQH